ncbi:MAG: GIY-YIG nuclease family protein [Treponema sp.]|nr:GIY-YIG nuclease family protein [Treponema sp.]
MTGGTDEVVVIASVAWQSRKINMKYYVYILFSKRNGTLYCGMTNNLERRMQEHKHKINDGFTAKYNVNKLGYYEEFSDAISAIEREKQIKDVSRKAKIKLIEKNNPEWKDLSDFV